MTSNLQNVDHMALKTNQASIIFLSIISFLIDVPLLAFIIAVIMALGTLLRKPGFFIIYRVLKKFGWLQPELLQDNPEPHRFAQGFGAVFLGAGAILTISGFSFVGWGFVWIVIFLAALNLFVGFCVGCALYYWFMRMNIPGFKKTAPSGIFPGRRPNL